MKDRVLVFGVAGLAVAAAAGWMRQPSPVSPVVAPYVSNFQPLQDATIPMAAQPVSTPFAVRDGVYRPQPQAAAPVQTARRNVARDRTDPAANREYRTRNRVYEDDRRPEIRNERRSTKASAAIIGGSAAAGALVGAVAGGGKGAAIGAVAGGAGGYIYDRATKNKKSEGYRTSDASYGREGRSKLESAAIIGGGAATGAAVGGMAGGGKGAAIGAIAGGAGGYVYDRMTKNR